MGTKAQTARSVVCRSFTVVFSLRLSCCRELTYPDPRGILRLTFIVLAATAVLTALVWSIDRTFAALLFPPVARRLCQGASLRGL